MMKRHRPWRPACGVVFASLVLLALARPAAAQFENKWLSAGSLHNWYSEIGNEGEERGFVRTQQDGMAWPGIYRFTDMQAWKGLWIGARNVRGTDGITYPVRVVHAGPRVTGAGEFFPVEFKHTSRYPVTDVTVDGELSEGTNAMVVDEVDPTLEADQVIYTKVNTLLGLTVERRVLQFSQEYHDNYHVIEYTLTNTGNADADAEIELNQTLTDVYFFQQWRWAVAKETRYVIGNGTGWGMNTMIDARGDGVLPDPPGEQFRAQFAWHGKFPAFTLYDNIGGPILPSALPATQIAPTDTLGRLGAYQFVGVVTLHADASPTNPADDPAQPAVTTWIGSDDTYQSQNDAFNPSRMETEYAVMTTNKNTRHAYVIEPTGLPGFLQPTGDPANGTTGGYSAANGYGPYTLAPGQSVRIVIAEAAAGISRELANETGRRFRRGEITALQKNQIVFQGRDSLFQTFRRALANHAEGYDIPMAPPPPTALQVNSGGDRIQVAWDYPAGVPVDGFEVYRAKARFDSTYTLIHTAGAADRSFDDRTPVRGLDYYYYVQAVRRSGNDGGGQTPAGRPLRSSRYYAQTYIPARLKRPMGEALADVRVVPNPFNLGSSPDVRWPDQTDKLGFLNIPGRCRIDIYTEIGELVDTIEHTDGSGDAYWNHTTASRQVVASGLYIAVITVTDDIVDEASGETVFRKGDRAFRKFVIIR